MDLRDYVALEGGTLSQIGIPDAVLLLFRRLEDVSSTWAIVSRTEIISTLITKICSKVKAYGVGLLGGCLHKTEKCAICIIKTS